MNTEPISNYCPKCQAPLPASAPQGLCPKCLLAAAAAPTEAGQPASSRAGAPPALDIVAAAFPQLEILGLIGSGGMGIVYKARQPRLDRYVALKLLPQLLAADAAFTERFNREARMLAGLNHPGIVTVYDFGQAGGFFFLLMEFVDGVNLRQAMQAGRFTPQQAFSLVPKICDALQFAHDEGILHRDIKPENILLDTKGRVKLADFGIAKLVDEPRPVTKLTATGAALGTPNYMAPEQLEHPEDVDQRADIYSIGVVFYEMLTGELPLGRFAPPSEKASIDQRVDEIVLKALARERELRQQSAGEVKTQVENLQTPASRDVSARSIPAAGSVGAAPLPIPAASRTADHGWSWMAIWGAVLSGLSLPLPLLILLAGLLRLGGIGAGELWITFGSVACLGTPGILLGWMALSQIRRSQGQLQGLPLALFAAFIWPFLVLFLATALPLLLVGTSQRAPWGLALVCLSMAVLAFGVWAVRAAARWSSGPASAQTQASAHPYRPSPEVAAGKGASPRTSWRALASAALSFPAWVTAAIMTLQAIVLLVQGPRGFFRWGIVVPEARVLIFFPGAAALILGIVALLEIRLSNGRLRGTRPALLGVLGAPLCFFIATTPWLLMRLVGAWLPSSFQAGLGLSAPAMLIWVGIMIAVAARLKRWTAQAVAPTAGASNRHLVYLAAQLAALLILIPPAGTLYRLVFPTVSSTNSGLELNSNREDTSRDTLDDRNLPADGSDGLRTGTGQMS